MFQWFIKFPEFTEFPFYLGKTPLDQCAKRAYANCALEFGSTKHQLDQIRFIFILCYSCYSLCTFRTFSPLLNCNLSTKTDQNRLVFCVLSYINEKIVDTESSWDIQLQTTQPHNQWLLAKNCLSLQEVSLIVPFDVYTFMLQKIRTRDPSYSFIVLFNMK